MRVKRCEYAIIVGPKNYGRAEKFVEEVSARDSTFTSMPNTQ